MCACTRSARPSSVCPLVLLVGAALMIRLSLALGSIDPDFVAPNVLTMRTSLTGPRFESSAGVEQMLWQSVDRLRALPGVEQAATTCWCRSRGICCACGSSSRVARSRTPVARRRLEAGVGRLL